MNAKNIDNDTPLHYAVKINDNYEIIKILINYVTNVNAKNKANNTPLHYAV